VAGTTQTIPNNITATVLQKGIVIDTRADFVTTTTADTYVMQLPQGFSFTNESMQARDTGNAYTSPTVNVLGILEPSTNVKFQFPAIIGQFTCAS